MRIYIDLDETLIHAIYAHSGNPGKRRPIEIKNSTGEREELYYSILRPKATELLSFCRTLGNVKMLTTATRDYALEHNSIFNLGFEATHIIAREDYLVSTVSAYDTRTGPVKTATDPHSVLIDNLPRLAELAITKQQYLGIKPNRYIQIREFSGKDPEVFTKELDSIFQLLKSLKKETPQHFDKIEITEI
jgi:hypothetical protein